MNDIITDTYSCGYCGWCGEPEGQKFIPDNPNEPECDGRFVCPECESEQAGEITAEDFQYGNILHGHDWIGFHRPLPHQKN